MRRLTARERRSLDAWLRARPDGPWEAPWIYHLLFCRLYGIGPDIEHGEALQYLYLELVTSAK